jgi:hypothetical protein
MDRALTDTLNQILGSKAVLVLTQIAVGPGLLCAIDKFFKLCTPLLAPAGRMVHHGHKRARCAVL